MSNNSDEVPGYVYILRADYNMIKVGYTIRNPFFRLDELQYCYDSASITDVFCCFTSNRPRYYELKVHRLLSKYRVGRTEVFQISPDDALEIINLKCKRLAKNILSNEELVVLRNSNHNHMDYIFEKYYNYVKKINSYKNILENYDAKKMEFDIGVNKKKYEHMRLEEEYKENIKNKNILLGIYVAMSFFSFAEKSIFAYVFILLIILNFATRKEKPREFYTPIFMSRQDIINKIDTIENEKRGFIHAKFRDPNVCRVKEFEFMQRIKKHA